MQGDDEMTSIKIEDLGKLKLNELQAKFAEMVGETTRSPNRTYLIRRITEAIVAAQTTGTEVTSDIEVEPVSIGHGPDDGAAVPAPRLSRLDIPALQACYLEIIGRTTGSTNRDYLLWKIRQAQKGRIPIGPHQGHRNDQGVVQVLPLRMESALVRQLDDAWRRLGLRSRMDLFRASLRTYLGSVGENEIANLVVAGPDA